MSVVASVRKFIVPIHPEGYLFIVAAVVLALFVHWLVPAIGWLFWILPLFVAYFFRDPPRVSPTKEGLILSPADGRVAAALKAGGAYTLIVGKGFEAWNERTLAADREVKFTVAAAPKLKLDGDYVMTVEHPNLDMENKRYDPSVIIPIEVALKATANGYGATVEETVTPLMKVQLDVVVAGETSYWPPFPFPVGPGFLNRSFPTEMLLVDDDADGVADRGESTLLLRSPGLEASGVVWRIARDTGEPMDCAGMEGEHVVDLMTDAMGLPTVSWADDVDALGYYVTDVAAKTPLGPGPVTDGETYWAVSTASFPTGFRGPVVYGELPMGGIDVSEDSMAQLGGAPLPAASCVKLTLVFSDFKSSVLRYQTP